MENQKLNEMLETLTNRGVEAFIFTKYDCNELKPNDDIKADIWKAESLHNDERVVGFVDIYQCGKNWGVTDEDVSNFINLGTDIVDPVSEPEKLEDGGYLVGIKPYYLTRPVLLAYKLPANQHSNLLLPISSLTYWQYCIEGLLRINKMAPETHPDRANIMDLFYDYLSGLEQFYNLPNEQAIHDDNPIARYCSAFWLSHCKETANLANTLQGVN